MRGLCFFLLNICMDLICIYICPFTNESGRIRIAGKDRTGVLAALILLLADTPSDAIVHDFALSRVGIEPARKMLIAAFPTISGTVTPESAGWLQLVSVRAPAMAAFLDTVEQSFGGVKGYLTGVLGFSDEDVEIMRANLKGN